MYQIISQLKSTAEMYYDGKMFPLARKKGKFKERRVQRINFPSPKKEIGFLSFVFGGIKIGGINFPLFSMVGKKGKKSWCSNYVLGYSC